MSTTDGRHPDHSTAAGEHKSGSIVVICHDDTVIVNSLDISHTEFEAATGWAIKPEGACKGDICVPLSEHRDSTSIAARLGMAVVADEATGRYAIGPASLNGRALSTADMPDIVLSDLDGNDVHLSRFRGEKLVLVGWAPY